MNWCLKLMFKIWKLQVASNYHHIEQKFKQNTHTSPEIEKPISIKYYQMFLFTVP